MHGFEDPIYGCIIDMDDGTDTFIFFHLTEVLALQTFPVCVLDAALKQLRAGGQAAFEAWWAAAENSAPPILIQFACSWACTGQPMQLFETVAKYAEEVTAWSRVFAPTCLAGSMARLRGDAVFAPVSVCVADLSHGLSALRPNANCSAIAR